jgi:hypothetical protein
MRRRTTRALIAALVAVLALVASACGAQGPSAAESDEVIRTGAWYPITGAPASFGIPERVGVDAYVRSVNARRDRRSQGHFSAPPVRG